MEPILTAAEMNEKRLMLQDYAPAQEAFAMLEKHNGRLDTSFDELWVENHNVESFAEPRSGKSLWQVTLKTLRAELCGDDGLRPIQRVYQKSWEYAFAYRINCCCCGFGCFVWNTDRS